MKTIIRPKVPSNVGIAAMAGGPTVLGGTATGRLADLPWSRSLRGRVLGSIPGSGAALFALKIAGNGLGLGMHLVIARLLGVSSYGTFATAFNAANLVALFAAFGMPLTASRFIPTYLGRGERDHASGYLDAVELATLAGGIVGAGMLLVAALVLRNDRTGLGAAIAAASPLVLLLSAAQTATALLQALHRPLAAEFPILVLRPVIVAAACMILALPAIGSLDATTALVVIVLATALSLWPVARTLAQALSPHELPARGRLLLASWLPPGALLLLIVGGAALNERLDVMIVSSFVDPANAGIYSVCARFAAVISLGTAAATVRAMPLIAESLARYDRAGAAHAAMQASRTALALATASGLPLFLIAGPLLGVFGPGFSSGATALRILVVGHATLAVGVTASTVLIASGKERHIALVSGVGIVANLAMNVIFVPRYGMNGAAIATCATMALTGIGLLATVRRVLGIGIFTGSDLRA